MCYTAQRPFRPFTQGRKWCRILDHNQNQQHREPKSKISKLLRRTQSLSVEGLVHFSFIYIASVTILSLHTLDTVGIVQATNIRQQWQKNTYDRKTRTRLLLKGVLLVASTARDKLDPWPMHWRGYWPDYGLMLAGFGSDKLPEIVSKAWLQLPELTQCLSQIWDNARMFFFAFMEAENMHKGI